MLEGKGLIDDTDMPMKLQIQAMKAASEALDLYDVFDTKSISAHIKKVPLFNFTSYLTIFIYHPFKFIIITRKFVSLYASFLNVEIFFFFGITTLSMLIMMRRENTLSRYNIPDRIYFSRRTR